MWHNFSTWSLRGGGNFIDSDTIREQERPAKILEAYPCLRDIDHVSMITIHTLVQFISESVLLNIGSLLLYQIKWLF